MPRIELVPEVLHQAMDPYNFQFDNLPLNNILDRQKLINFAVDNNAQEIRQSVGTQGSLSNRLAQSIAPDGGLKTAAVDDSLHNIGAHTDGSFDDGGGSIDYVRMTSDERAKLDLISDEATSLSLRIEFDSPSSTTVDFTDTIVEILPSTTIQWSITAPNKIKAETAFPETAVHMHFYDQGPILLSGGLYKINTPATPFIEDSLRVFVNGIRLTRGVGIWVPPASGPDGTWILTYYTPDFSGGKFTLNRTLDIMDIIRIDYDRPFV